MFTDDDGEVAGRIKENLVSTYSKDRGQWDGLAMTSQFRKGLFFTDAVGIPCHDETLHSRALEQASAARW